MRRKYRHLFGPVPSRRLGLSLGVDLTPGKTCSLDCVFCQLGRTTNQTVCRDEYFPTESVLAELTQWLRTASKVDFVTLSGCGEPTLHSRFGEVLEFIRMKSSIPTALLTNGTMLCLPEVRAAASHADVVKVSLSAWDESSYQWVNRPHPDLRFAQLIQGQMAFRSQFGRRLWLEVFLVNGMNSMPADVGKIAALTRQIAPDLVQLNTTVRPPTESFATAVPQKRMTELKEMFQPPAQIITEFSTRQPSAAQLNREMILAMLQRRPCTLEEISKVCGMHRNEVSKYLGSLLRTKQIRVAFSNHAVFYDARADKTLP